MNTLPTQPEIPPSLDEFGSRKTIIPAEVRGRFRKSRNWTQAALLLFFLISPWATIGGEQALFLNIAKKEFHFFGLHLYAHDAPLAFFLLVIAAFGLIFVTTVWGRAYCGWMCPQTVFIDGVFRRIEILVEGNYLKRRQYARGPLSREILLRKTLKWILFFIAASLIAHSFVAFFVGSRQLLNMIGYNPQENWSYFLLITAMTSIVLFDFAWFREQFCLIVCPYGRIQSVLLGRRTLNIAYDAQRGEPRKGLTTPVDGKSGDCVSCRRCVEVCPTGIDIRHGLQLECIACTACIDACDEIMEKVKKPKGLIRYMNTTGGSNWSVRSPRALFSLVIVFAAISVLTILLYNRGTVDINVLRGKDALFQSLSENGQNYYTNHFKVHIKNQTGNTLAVLVVAHSRGEPVEAIMPENPMRLSARQDREHHFFVKFLPSLLHAGKAPLELKFMDATSGDILASPSVQLVGPASP